MNKVLLIGRLTNEPEKRTTSSGISFVRFSIAVKRTYSKDQVDFVPIVAWRQSADFISNYVHKGYMISVEGAFTSSRYKNASDQMVTRYEVTADRVSSLEQRRNDNNYERETETVPGLTNIKFESDIKKDDSKIETEKQSNANDDVPWDIEF